MVREITEAACDTVRDIDADGFLTALAKNLEARRK